MDPHAVRGVGSGLGQLGAGASCVASDLEALRLPVTDDGLGLARDVAPVLAVWADAVHALATELGLLEERCARSAASLEAEDELARHRFAGRVAGAGGA